MKVENKCCITCAKIPKRLCCHSPLDGRSEYLVQKTQAGQSCPFGPRTMPGGTSPSAPFFGLSSPAADEDEDSEQVREEERSTGLLPLVWLLLLLFLPPLLLLLPPPWVGSDALLLGGGGEVEGSCLMSPL